MKCKKSSGWHRADVIAELRKKGLSLSGLGRVNSLSPYTLKNALDKPYRRGEQIIADALGVEPKAIWPERYL